LSSLLVVSASDLLDAYPNTRIDGLLGDVLKARCEALGRKSPQGTEIETWNESLPALAEQLRAAGLGHLVLFIEVAMHPFDEEADVIIAGAGHDGRPYYTLVELKRWTEFEVLPSGRVMAGSGRGKVKSKRHPADQAAAHTSVLSDLFAPLDPQYFIPVVLLHNATEHFMEQLEELSPVADPVMFGANGLPGFRKFMQARYGDGDATFAANLLNRARSRQPDVLFQRMDAEFDDTAGKRFALVGDQWEAYRLVSEAAETALSSGRPAAVIVRGKPGTGKTAVALKLAGEYFRRKQTPYYWTWQVAFREGLQKNSGLRTADAKRLFRSPRQKHVTADTMRLSAEISLCDEAHRLEEKTQLLSHRRKTPQIDDILWCSRVHVFFVDDDQQVAMKEIGTAAQLRRDLERNKVQVTEIELTTQVRSQGLNEYVDWVRRLVGIDPYEPRLWRQRDDFRIWIAEHPAEVDRILASQAEEDDRYRVTAGICWEPDHKGFGDVVIGDWRKPWNLKKPSEEGPVSTQWGWAKGGFRQLGCVHTAQGLDWEWAGVVIGPDLVRRDGRIETRLEENTDLPNYASPRDWEKRQKAEKLIRNAYYILMTRGIKGTVIYAQDNLLRQHLRSLVEPLSLPASAEPEDKWSRARAKLPQTMIDAVDKANDSGFGLPHVGLDYVPGHRSVLAWRDRLTAVLPDDLSTDQAAQAIQAYTDAGWVARQQADWDSGSLWEALNRERGGSTELDAHADAARRSPKA
jgi:DUF2075 family protein/KaiC/GvpD/RAD55 family RecA-like ATPase